MANIDTQGGAGPSKGRSFVANFWRDVFENPSVGAVTAWLVGSLIMLVGWLTVSYAPGTTERAGACGTARADAAGGIIPLDRGYRTLALVVALTFIAGVQPVITKRFSGWVEAFADWHEGAGRVWRGPLTALGAILAAPVNLLAWAFSLLDWLLARPLALLAGTSLQPWPLRYGVFLAWMGLALGCAWLAPAPLGLYGFVFGVALILGVVRRWNWVERDREAFFIARKQDPASERIGFAEDLRDEALISLIFLFVLIPLGLRQVELLHPDTFCIDGAAPSEASVFAWLGFFGAELAKSVPFVDWSEVFHVANGSPIEPNTVLGAQVVFAMRATLDLLMIAAVTQAVQLAGRLAEQNRAFASGQVDILEPFVERTRLRALGLAIDRVSEGKVIELKRVAAFPAYSPARLAQIVASGADEHSVQAAADSAARRAALALAVKQAVLSERPEEAAPLITAATRDTSEPSRNLALRLAAESVPVALMAPVYSRAKTLIAQGGVDAASLLLQYPEQARPLARRAILSATGDLDAMVRIEAGEFVMGAPEAEAGSTDRERPQRVVKLRAFEIGRYPVTFDEFDAFIAATDYWVRNFFYDGPDDAGFGRGRRPVINVSWFDALAYINWLNSWSDGGYRLPSEAEWEYACRAQSTTCWSFGDNIEELPQAAWFRENSNNMTHPVGERSANAWSLHDMHGNVWEWCQDPPQVRDPGYEGAPNTGEVWISDDASPFLRVCRGGAWNNDALELRSAARNQAMANERFLQVGFRIARSVQD